MRVLIAEDDPITRRILQRQIEQWGHEVATAEDGVKAWDHFCRDNFSIVISDWMMPEMDGLDLVRRIRNRQGGYVYVILLTAKSEKEDLVKGMESGADDFLSKPFDRHELRVRLRAGERIIELERSLAERNELLQAANHRMSRDLEAAAALQRSLLPAELPSAPGVAFAWNFRPCDELAGDFLNVFRLDDQHVALYVADVSGHGVVASLLAVSISRMLTAHPSVSSLLLHAEEKSGKPRIVSPAEVARQLNRRFQMDDLGGKYFTVVYGVLNTETGRLRYASTGHPSMIRLPLQGEPVLLDGSGVPIGWDADVDYEERIVNLEAGDRLCLYSDGVPEAMDDALEEFGAERLIQTWVGHRSADLRTAVSTLIDKVEQWCGPAGPKDDVSILAVEILPSPPNSVRDSGNETATG